MAYIVLCNQTTISIAVDQKSEARAIVAFLRNKTFKVLFLKQDSIYSVLFLETQRFSHNWQVTTGSPKSRQLMTQLTDQKGKAKAKRTDCQWEWMRYLKEREDTNGIEWDENGINCERKAFQTRSGAWREWSTPGLYNTHYFSTTTRLRSNRQNKQWTR